MGVAGVVPSVSRSYRSRLCHGCGRTFRYPYILKQRYRCDECREKLLALQQTETDIERMRRLGMRVPRKPRRFLMDRS